MKYKGFHVKITPDSDLLREDKDGNDVRCEGFTIEVFADESEQLEIDIFRLLWILNCWKTVSKKRSSSLRIILTARKKSTAE